VLSSIEDRIYVRNLLKNVFDVFYDPNGFIESVPGRSRVLRSAAPSPQESEGSRWTWGQFDESVNYIRKLRKLRLNIRQEPGVNFMNQLLP
jgi:hypothetical protein